MGWKTILIVVALAALVVFVQMTLQANQYPNLASFVPRIRGTTGGAQS